MPIVMKTTILDQMHDAKRSHAVALHLLRYLCGCLAFDVERDGDCSASELLSINTEDERLYYIA
jgi:hypothetical protein